VLFAGTLLNATGRKSYGCAPTPVIRATDGRIYREFDNTLGVNLIMTKEPVTPSTDLLSADSWMETTAAPFVPEKMVPRGYVPPILCRGGRGKCIASGCAAPNCGCNCFTAMEGNVVQAPNGTMLAILRFDGQSNYTYNKAVVFRRERDNANPAGRMIFSQMIDFPSTSSKFTIRKHPHDGHYYTLSTAVTSAAIAGASQCASWNTPNCQKTIAARNHLVLARSSDLVKWHSCETLLTDDTGFGLLDSARFTGFQYVDWVFDRRISSTIHYAVRTGYRGSNTYHNANRLTVKSIQRISWLCSWTDQFSDVGEGWCRPTANFTNAGTGLTTRDCALRCLQSSRCAAFAMNVQCALYPSFPTNTSGHGGFHCFGKLQGPSDFAPRRSYGQMKLDDDTAKARGDRHNASTATAASAAVPPDHHGRSRPGVTTIALLDHGAACDGVRSDTEAFVSALAAAGAAVSAGAELVEVHVPSHRTCLTGPFNITSNSTTLFLEEGSTVKAADDPSLWPRGWPLPTFGPHELFSSFVGLYSVRGSGVAGPGSLDMNGGAWHGGRLDPRNDYKNLPKFLTVHDCADVHIRGVSLLNGANWNIHLVFSTNCSVDGVRIVTPFKGTDGIDVDSSTHIQITNVFVHNGDDCTTSISIMIINLDWLRFAYVFRCRY
jgi:hypothetical protein